MCLNALFAGVPCAGDSWIRSKAGDEESQCPFRGRALCGRRLGRDRHGGSSLSQCPFRGRALCGGPSRWLGAPAFIVSQCPFAGVPCAGGRWAAVSDRVSMPLMRARRGLLRSRMFPVSQCPFCGRALCGMQARTQVLSASVTVSMPFSRACPVRAATRLLVAVAAAPCLNALDAGGPCAGRDECSKGAHQDQSMSQCPLCGRALCGQYGSMARLGNDECLSGVSMPFIAGGPCAGGLLAGPSGWPSQSACLNALDAGGPCAGIADRRRDPRDLPVSMPLMRAGPVRASFARRLKRRSHRTIVSMPFSRACPVRAGWTH